MLKVVRRTSQLIRQGKICKARKVQCGGYIRHALLNSVELSAFG